MKRLIEYLITGWIIITINFLLPRIVPGNPLLYITGETSGDIAISVDKTTKEKLKKYYNLDKTLSHQYWLYLKSLCSADLGHSIHFKLGVASLIWQALPWTLLLTLSAIILAAIIGIFLGTLSAWYRNSLLDKGLLFFLMCKAALPSFLLAILLQIIFSIKLGIFPSSGALTFYQQYSSPIEKLFDILWHCTLPILTLTIVLIPENYLLVRNSLINVLGKDYILTARMKGLSEWKVMYKHAFGNVLLPLLTHISLRLGLAVGGMIFIETVFSYPGMGYLMYKAVLTHDYPVAQGIFLVIAIVVLSINFLMDSYFRSLQN